jgi:hypothetical protein
MMTTTEAEVGEAEDTVAAEVEERSERGDRYSSAIGSSQLQLHSKT